MSLLSHKSAQQTNKMRQASQKFVWYAIRSNSLLEFESVKRHKDVMFMNNKFVRQRAIPDRRISFNLIVSVAGMPDVIFIKKLFITSDIGHNRCFVKSDMFKVLFCFLLNLHIALIFSHHFERLSDLRHSSLSK